MKVILALTLIFAICSSSMVTKRDIDSLMQSKWGKIFLNMAQLQIQAGGPIEDLISAIQDLQRSDEQKLDAATDAFDQRTAEHERTVSRLTDAITKAQSELANAQNFIENTLKPQRAALIETINLDENQIKENIAYVEQITVERKQNQADFEQKVRDAEEATAAINEALELLNGLGDDDAASLIQLKSAQKKLKKITDKLAKGSNESWIRALVQIASSDYANSEALGRVITLLENVRSNISEHIENETNANDRAIENFKREVAAREQQTKDLRAEIADCKVKLEQTNDAIQQTEELIVRIRADIVALQQDLEDENESYRAAEAAYQDLKAQFEKEIAACEQAIGVLQRGLEGMADYIRERQEEGITPLTEAHGQKINVHDYSYDK